MEGLWPFCVAPGTASVYGSSDTRSRRNGRFSHALICQRWRECEPNATALLDRGRSRRVSRNEVWGYVPRGCGSAPANGEKISTPSSRSAVSFWRESLPSIAQGGSGKFDGADATQNGQKPSLVVELDV